MHSVGAEEGLRAMGGESDDLMGFLNLRKKKAAATDADADLDGLTVEEAAHLRDLFAAHWPSEAGAITMHGEYAETEGGAQLGLYNLSRAVRAVPREQWPQVVAGHISGLLGQESRPADGDLSDAEILALVKARVISSSYLPDTHAPNFTYRRAIAEGLEAILMLDHPETTTAIPDEIVNRFDAETLWSAAIAASIEEPVDAMQTIGEGTEAFQVAVGDSFFTSSRALDMPAALARFGAVSVPHGVLFAVPTRHLLAFRVVDGPEAVHAVAGMQQFVQTVFDQQPGEISPHLYYWNDGLYELAASIDAEGRVNVDGNSAFFAAINSF